MGIEVPEPQAWEAPKIHAKPRSRRPPAMILAAGFAALIVLGTILLMLPFASESGAWTDPVRALFTATSAVCVTGLVVVDTATYWSAFGEVVILGLIQVGGLGFMTGSTLLLLVFIGRRTSLSDRMLAQESAGARDLGSVTSVLRRVALFTVVVEGVGTVALTGAFLVRYGDVAKAGWHGAFHSISAFNNAGFDLMGGFRSLNDFSGDFLVLVPIGLTIFLGGLGVAIVDDVIAKRRWARLALETKLVLVTTGLLLVGGMGALLLFESSNAATLGGVPPLQRPANALFEAVSFRTAGMSSIPIGGLTDASLQVAIVLMFIGGASGSTAGGIKITTFAILLFTIISTIRGRPWTEAFGRRVNHETVYRAMSIGLLAVAVAFAATVALGLTGASATLIDLAFEAVSAFGTVGHTTGITPSLPSASLLVLVVAMYVGRLGPLTLALALSTRMMRQPYRPAVESMRIG